MRLSPLYKYSKNSNLYQTWLYLQTCIKPGCINTKTFKLASKSINRKQNFYFYVQYLQYVHVEILGLVSQHPVYNIPAPRSDGMGNLAFNRLCWETGDISSLKLLRVKVFGLLSDRDWIRMLSMSIEKASSLVVDLKNGLGSIP